MTDFCKFLAADARNDGKMTNFAIESYWKESQ